jgi:hypothetical protein
VGIVEEVAVRVELEEGARDELIALMARVILAVYNAGSEVHDEPMAEPEDPR